MFILIGEGTDLIQSRVDGGFDSVAFEAPVARFESKADAKGYAESMRLKQRVHGSYEPDKVFRADSLLAIYNDYRIETEVVLPIRDINGIIK